MQSVLLPYPRMARLFGEDPAASGGRGKSTCFLGPTTTLDFTSQPVGADPPQSVTVTVTFVSFVNRTIGFGAMLGAENVACRDDRDRQPKRYECRTPFGPARHARDGRTTDGCIAGSLEGPRAHRHHTSTRRPMRSAVATATTEVTIPWVGHKVQNQPLPCQPAKAKTRVNSAFVSPALQSLPLHSAPRISEPNRLPRPAGQYRVAETRPASHRR
jgi:hypothetical protein